MKNERNINNPTFRQRAGLGHLLMDPVVPILLNYLSGEIKQLKVYKSVFPNVELKGFTAS